LFSSIKSGTIYGLQGYLIDVEVDFSKGLPCFVMVGSLKSEVKESAERVRIALKNMGITIPPMHIAVNLSPADIKKSGTGFDFSIALGLLVAMERVPSDRLKDTLVMGEIGLTGEIKRINGVMPIVWEAKKRGITTCLVPKDNVEEAALVEGVKVIGINDLKEAMEYLNIKESAKRDAFISPIEVNSADEQVEFLDFADVVGQESLKRGALIAASGAHHMLIIGPPGAGKTMIAKRISSIMPPMSMEESMDVTSIYSIAGLLDNDNPVIKMRPFVSPHHTVSPQGMAGGGLVPRPGSVSLAHKGVLFLDELPEFTRQSIDMLRQPLEDKSINISRASGSFTYPADIMLVAAMNPCPCGFYPDYNKCSCSPLSIKHYLSHISGPIMDRIDICLTVKKVSIGELNRSTESVSSKELLSKVIKARDIQSQRYINESYDTNASIDAKGIKKYCKLSDKNQKKLEDMCNRLDLSARAYHRLLKVSRTIADLDSSEEIKEEHLYEAICYRPQNGLI